MVALRRAGAWVAGLAATVLAVVLIVRYVDHRSLGAAWSRIAGDPLGLAFAAGTYTLAFLVRGVIWCRVLPSLPLGQSVAAIHVTLLGNHVLPMRLGEPLRVVSVAARAGIPLGPAFASTVSMRAADILGVAVLGLLLGPGLVVRLLGPWGIALILGGATVAGAGGLWWLRRTARRAPGRTPLGGFRMPGLVVGTGALAAWVLESVMLWQAARWVGWPVGFVEAIVVTAITVGAQIVALAPAGIGTFEAAGTAALAAAGVPAGRALAVIVVVHVLTTVYSIVTGAIALVVPRPALRWSRLRAAMQQYRRAKSAGTPSAGS
jgi:uncharacterized membrane protein YbhN (UPF0104 family)